jgi:hypothetical protein
VSDIKRRLSRLESAGRPGPEDEQQREEKRERIRQEAERMNERYLERRPIERELARLEGETDEPLEGDDLPPFTITEDGEVFCSRDGKPVTEWHQTLAEEWFWWFHEAGYNPRGLVYDEATQGYYMPDPPHELAFSRDHRCYLPRFFWALGDERADPYCIHTSERLGVPKLRDVIEVLEHER